MISDPVVTIGSLRIRTPGQTVEQARSLGAEIARRVVDGLPDSTPSREVGEIRVRVQVPAGSSHESLVSAVANAIEEALR
jgi:hypothetical protein